MDNNINLGYSDFFSSVRKSNLVNILPTNVQTVNLGEKSVTTSKIADLAVGTAQIDNAAITNAKIASLTWDKGQGGTLTLGGQNNTSGLLSLKDATGTEVIHMDNTGMTVNNGTITVKNTNGTTIIDGMGLVSTANFANNYVISGASQNTTSQTFVDITGMTLTFTLTRTANVLFMVSLPGGNADVANGGICVVQLLLDSTAIGGQVLIPGSPHSGGGVVEASGAMSTISSVSSGTHTAKLQFRSTSVGNASYVGGYASSMFLGYIVLGS